ncbi:MAG: molybdopterin-synthase adenylyltransferase MoeB [Alphaproteobacteria bacterium]|jgi:adenylyltransferase/sulfurtransferase
MADLQEDQIQRYARHIVLQEVGGVGQSALLEAKVLVVGAGGLGSPLLMYLAAAGVGTIGVVDDDIVTLSNLQRQIAHGTPDIGRAKVDSAKDRAAVLNPEVKLVPYQMRLNPDNVMDLLAAHDIIADGSDNFDTRFLLNDACYLAKKTLVSAAVLRFDGQLSTYKAHLGPPHPCYRCIFPEPPLPDAIPSCSQGGVLGAMAGVMGTMQATEVLKEILGIGQGMSGRLLIHDGLAGEFRTVRVKPDPNCALCGQASSIFDLSLHGGVA